MNIITANRDFGLSHEETERTSALVPSSVCDATCRMYSPDGTDSDALVYVGYVVSSMLGAINATISLCVNGGFDGDKCQKNREYEFICTSMAHFFEERGFELSAELAKAASRTIGNLSLSMAFISMHGKPGPHDESSIKTYIVKSRKSGLIKIGKSISPSSRIRTIETTSGSTLDVIAIIDADIERELHLKFADIRGLGEWFLDDGRIAAHAAELMRGKQ